VSDAAAWEAFCDALRRAGAHVLAPGAPADPVTRAEGFRYLSRLARAGLEAFVEAGDPRFPAFYRLSHETLKIGADNPDNLYLNARVDGRLTYRLTGTRGTVAYLGLSTKAGGYGSTGGLAPTGFLDSSALRVEPDGRLAVTVSATPHEGNWLPMTAESTMLIVRQTFRDRAAERPAELRIERVGGGEERPEPLGPAALAAGLAAAARFVDGTAALFAAWARGFAAHPNALPRQDQARYQRAGGDPSIHYFHGYWALAPDEALVVHLPRIPPCETWNFQLNNHWMESLDYRWHRISVNAHTAAANPDGSVTIVVAHRDPGRPNWLETAGHGVGTMCLRWIGAREVVDPVTRVARVDAL
jgi:hypothetical protein